MQRELLPNAERYAKRNKRRSIWKKIVGGLACAVVFCTTYALILPAITQEEPVFCGLSEHTHGQACYSQVEKSQLTCSPESLDIHVHGTECVDADGNDVCAVADYVAHTHGPSCTDAEGAQVCLLPEIGLHVHADSCYVTHAHDEGCYDAANGETVCVIPESELLCTEPQAQVHVHADDCFEIITEQALTCQNIAHSHGLACRADSEADLEAPEDREKTFSDVTLTGSWPEDVVAIAQTQLGYTESTRNFVVLEDGQTVKGYTRYGGWYGEAYRDWSSLFVGFCLEHAAVEDVPFLADCGDWIDVLSDEGCGLYKPAQEHVPAPGDIIFFGREADALAELSGIVAEILPAEETEPAKLRVIAGDWGDRVQCIEIPVDDASILGYGDLNGAYAEYRQNKIIEKVYTDSSVTVKATYLPAAGIPEDAVLVVEKIQPGDAFDSCYQEAVQMLNTQLSDITTTEITDFQLYDISFQYDGEEIESTDRVNVQIVFPDTELTETEDVSIIHYGHEGTQLPEVQEYSVDENGDLNASFETESFSLFAIVTSRSSQTPIVSMEKYNITNNNISALPSGTSFAIVSGSYALTVDSSGKLAVETLSTLENGELSGFETVARWTFEKRRNSTYYISTTVNGQKNYLKISNGTLSLTTDQNYLSASKTGTNLRLASGSYIVLSASGVSTNTNVNTSGTTLSLYSVPAGPFSVTFDGQMGLSQYNGSTNKKYAEAGKETVTTDASGYVTLLTDAQIASPPNYKYKLNGWYDIVGQVYYDSSMLGQKVKVTSDTIFYPDWVAASYDIGKNEDVILGQPDTRDFIDTRVFDYNELFNVHSSTYSEKDDKWTFDPDSELGFIFFDYLTDSDGNIGDMLEKDVAVGGVTVNMEKTNGTRGSSINFPGTITPGIANDLRLQALFGTAPGSDEYRPMVGRTDLGEGDWLYDYDEQTGFYYYNSAKNAAAYNQKDQRFYVYDHTVHIDSQNSLNDFLPFNYDGASKTEYHEKDTEANYWFGMKSEITFFLPYDSGSGKNIAAFENDMQFRFSGDDDVWIFVDDQLVLDLGGVHDVVYGEINFSTGVTKTGQAISRDQIADNTASSYAGMPGVSGTAGVTTGTLPQLKGGEQHTITVYYLERGSSLSNCAIYFNVAPSYKLQIEKQDKQTQALLDGAQFQIFDDRDCTVPSNLFLIGEDGKQIGEETNTFTAADGVVTIWGMVPGRTYYIKETKPPTAIADHPGYPDMSGTVIQLEAGVSGGQNLIVLDSNENEWVFAVTDFNEKQQLIQLRVYNEAYIGGEKKIYAEKVWKDVESDQQEPVKLQLNANGASTGRHLILSEENDWKGYFYALPEKDSEGKTIVYTVEEEVPSGFTVEYAETQLTIVHPAGWEKATTLEDGETYLLVSNQGALSTVGADSELFRWSDKDLALSKEKGTESTQWLATASQNGFTLRSGDGRYLKIYLAGSDINIYASPNGDSSANTYTADFNIVGGKLKADDYYFTQIRSDSKVSTSSSGSDGLSFTLYKWTTNEETISGWRVTNTPWPEIPVEKQWDDTVAEEKRTEVTVELYRVITQSSVVDTAFEPRSLTLNADNEWAAVFRDVPPTPEGTSYFVIETTEGYKVSYSGQTHSILIDGKLREGAYVASGEDGAPATVTITNSPWDDIPVEKHWDDTVAGEKRTAISVALYRVATQSGVVDTTFEPRSLTLSADNDWAAAFEDVPPAPEGTSYFVIETTEGYKVSYSGQTHSVVIDGKLRAGAYVASGEDGVPVTVTVTNSALFLLPETGGIGTNVYIASGLALMIGAAVLMYITHKRRREVPYT